MEEGVQAGMAVRKQLRQLVHAHGKLKTGRMKAVGVSGVWGQEEGEGSERE